MLFLSIQILLGFIYYTVRTYLEDDAMIKARFLSKEYMQEIGISNSNEIDRIIAKYDELNNAGIKLTNFQLFNKTLIKDILLDLIFIVMNLV